LYSHVLFLKKKEKDNNGCIHCSCGNEKPVTPHTAVVFGQILKNSREKHQQSEKKPSHNG